MKKTTKYSVALVGTTLFSNPSVATSPEETYWEVTPVTTQDSFLSKIPADLQVRVATRTFRSIRGSGSWEPSIKVQGNGILIRNGDATPNQEDGTDFGLLETGNTLTNTFTLQNVGSEDVNLTDLVSLSAGCLAFSVTQQPSSTTLAPQASVPFQVTFAPTTASNFTCFLSIHGNEGLFNFVLKGRGLAKVPLTLLKTGSGSGTVTTTDGQLDCGEKCIATYLPGSKVTLTATPAEDSVFQRWQGGCSGNQPQTEVTIQAALDCTAFFGSLAVKHTLTLTKQGTAGKVVSDPAGLECGETCQAEFLEGATVQLIATAEPGASFLGWEDDCKDVLNPVSAFLVTDLACTIIFGQGGTPNLNVWPTTMSFDNAAIGKTVTRTVTLYNNGDAGVHLGAAELRGDPSFTFQQTHTDIAPQGYYHLEVQFQPSSEEPKTAKLTLPSNDPDTPAVTVTLEGVGCQAGNQKSASRIYPSQLDFGTQSVGQRAALRMGNWATGCGAPQLDTIQFTGDQASEFSFKNKQCYFGRVWRYFFVSYCRLTVEFLPTTEGAKSAQLEVSFDDPLVAKKLIPIQARAVIMQPQIEISPTDLDFGKVTIGRPAVQSLTIKNPGNANLMFNMTTSGDFSTNAWNCYWLSPGRECQVNVNFAPLSATDYSGVLNVTANATNMPTLEIPMKGTGQESLDCSPANITLQSVNSGAWNAPGTWDRDTPPTETDVVQINRGHRITALPDAVVKVLCIQPEATLESADNRGTPLKIRATDYLENHGTILGQDGANESENCTSKEQLGQGNCAYPGASVYVTAGNVTGKYDKLGEWWWEGSGGPVVNGGTIRAGKGGDGTQYAANGGYTIVLGRNTLNKQLIQAGSGGNVLGALAGEAGRGGATQIWGKLGGPGYLYNYGKTLGGTGGRCNPAATAPQVGGQGGNLWLVSLPDVHLHGLQEAGSGGTSCDGQAGMVIIEPNVISLSGAHTQVAGGEVTIFGGKDWTLDLSNLEQVVVEATGDVTLAVGEGGMIDLRGNPQPVLRTSGQVNLFADDIALDDGKRLTEIIIAKNIVVGPSKILQKVSLVGPERVTGQPATVIPLIFTLSNSGPEKDTYHLQISDTAGWSIGPLPATVTVEGLTTLDLTVEVTLPVTPETTDEVSLKVVSQSDPEVTAMATVRLEVAKTAAEAVTELPPSLPPLELPPSLPPLEVPPPTEIPTIETLTKTLPVLPPPIMDVIPPCPLMGTINFMCDNRWQTLSDVTLGRSAIVAGGQLAGIIENQGFISQVTILEGAEVTGGTWSGYIINHGTLRDFEFVGASLTGGQLAGTIRNNSQVGGVLIDVTFAPKAHLIGGRLQGTVLGDPAAPTLLEKVKVLSGSDLTGVNLGEGVVFEGNE